MSAKERDPRLTEAMREGKPPMLRCWVNEHFAGILFSHEAQVIVGSEDRPAWTIVAKSEIVYLGDSQRGDALGPFRDAYVHVRIFSDFSDEEGYTVNLASCDPGEDVRMKVAKESVVFAKREDPIWEEIGAKLEKEAEGKIPEVKALKPSQFAINLSSGIAVLREDK